MKNGVILISLGMLGVAVTNSASALVTINHAAVGATVINVGETVQIEVRASWDGQGGLYGIFSSTAADSPILVAESAVSPTGLHAYRSGLFPFTDPITGDVTALLRFGQDQLRHEGSDPTSLVRSLQYLDVNGAIDPRGAAQDVLVTTITFRALARGVTTIDYIQALGDTGVGGGDQLAHGPGVVVTVVPEPGTAFMLLLGLAGLGYRRRQAWGSD